MPMSWNDLGLAAFRSISLCRVQETPVYKQDTRIRYDTELSRRTGARSRCSLRLLPAYIMLL